MPELPEVESVRRSLLPCIEGKTLKKVEVRKPKIVRNEHFASYLQGATIKTIDRRAKLLIFRFSNREEVMVAHLKMTGQFLYQDQEHLAGGGHSLTPNKEPSLPHKHTHVIFSFTDESHLYFNDMRQFGYMQLLTPEQLEKALQNYGIEPLTPDFTNESFHKVFQKRTTSTKALLLNQKAIAGLGNIYVDEICYAAQVRPDRPANKLTKKEIDALHAHTEAIIKKAIDCGGTTFQYYTDTRGVHGNFRNHLQVFGKTDEPCPKTGVPIQKTRVAGRGTHWSPKWQR